MAQQLNHKWPDSEWIRRLKQEEPEAIEELHRQLEKWGNVAAGIPHNSLKWDFVVHDAAVDAFWKIINRLKRSSDDINNLAGFCRMCITNEVIDRRKWWDTRHPPTLAEFPENDETRIDNAGGENFLENVQGQEIRKILEDCLSQLKHLEREAVRLYYFNNEEELTYKEVGNRLGITGSYVGNLLCKALPKMKQCLEAKGYSSDLLSK